MGRGTLPSSEPALTNSAVMTTYNGARFLREQLDSLAAQQQLPSELIISDDASRDETVAVAEEFARTAPFPVRILRHAANVGILDNFYSAFAAATGAIIFYCDQDDVWDAGKIARVMSSFTADIALVTHQSRVTTADLAMTGRVEPGNAVYGRFASPANAATVHGFGHQMAFRREVLEVMRQLRPAAEQLDPDGVSYNLDQFIPLCASLVGGLVALPEALVSFRRHDRAVSGAGRALPGREQAAAKLRRVTARDAHAAEVRLRLVEAAVDRGLIPTDRIGALSRAFERRRQVCAATQAMLDPVGAGARARLLCTIVFASLRKGFSNRRPLHDIGLALFALMLGFQRRDMTLARGRRRDCPAAR